MIDRTPVPRDQRPALPAFTPVPRATARHDGWTPDRQRAFIEALADTGSVTTAARMVNMSSESAYALRRHPAAAGLREAWRAALDMGVERLRDEAMDRALNGQLVPVFAAGKLLGFRRKKNDRLLMFILRHHRLDREGRRVTINMFQQNASAPTTDGAAATPLLPRSAGEVAGAKRLTVGAPQPLLPAPDPAATVADFATVPLDDEAQALIVAALEANAARQRALSPEDDPAIAFIGVDEAGAYCGELECGTVEDDLLPRKPGEARWETLDDHAHLEAIDRAVEEVNAAREARARAEAEPAPIAPPALPPSMPTTLATPARPAPPASAPPSPPPSDSEALADIDRLIEAAKAEAANGYNWRDNPNVTFIDDAPVPRRKRRKRQG